MDYLAVLNALAPKFTVTPLVGAAGLAPSLGVVPPPEALGSGGSLSLSESVSEIAPVPVEVLTTVNLSIVGKWVRSANFTLPAEPAAETPIGGMPVAEQVGLLDQLSATLPPPGLMQSQPGQESVAGVPELLGRIKGTVSQAVEKVTDVLKQHPIGIAVRWEMFEESMGISAPATTAEYHNDESGNAPWATLAGAVQVPANGVPVEDGSRSIFLKFPAVFSELKTAVPEVMTFSVHVSIRLSTTVAGTTFTTEWISLQPPVPLVVPTIPVPTILVLCEHPDFAGRKLVLVPGGSAVGVGNVDIGSALSVTQSALAQLALDHPFAGFLAGSHSGAEVAANVLKALVASHKQTIVAAQSRVENLDSPEFVFDPGGWFGVGRFTADNMVSSVICVGRPGSIFDMFHDASLSERITRFQIRLGDKLGCAIRKLDTKTPADDVVYGGAVTSSSPVWENEDRITSLSFAGPSERFVAR